MLEHATVTLSAGRLICGLAGINIEIGSACLEGMVWTFIEVSGVRREQVVALRAA
jgi:hypothetical protein